jgi:DNA-binding FadR family transcriptional regulator
MTGVLIGPASRPRPGPVPGKNITHEVVDAICGMLRSGRYRIGDRLPGEHDLARELGVGRSAVREAVRELISLTLLEIRPGAGTFVRALRADVLFRTDSLGERFDPHVRAELLEVRRIVEPECAALAAERASDQDIAHLERDVVLLARGVARGAAQIAADLDFHVSLVRATHNLSLSRMSGAIISFYKHDRTPAVEHDVVEHRAIFEAIRDASPDRARQLMRAHLMNGRS